ncbi:MAG TPA: histidine kinase [Gaiellales bacterium]|jgi:signal transduction histidine kinase|nr:histidine kinase [Gaiellales bacterium]
MSSSTERLVTAGVAAAAAAAVVALVVLTSSDWLHGVLMLAAVAVAWFAIDRALRTTHALAERSREQGELFDTMLHTLDDERAALAMRLHDGPQQTMTAVRLMCDVIGDAIRNGDVDRANEVLARLEDVASGAADDLRRTVARLHPVVMEQQGLLQALGSLAETVHEEYGVDASFSKPAAGWEGDVARDTAIFQIAREAAINAARHGRSPVSISLEHEDGRISLAVEDAGGTLPAAPSGGIGIRMMQERATQIGAAITLDRSPGQWSAVRLELPAAGASAR